MISNIPSGDGQPGVKAVYKLKNLLSGVCESGCSLFIMFLNLPPGNCLPGCSVLLGSELNSRGLLQEVQSDFTWSEHTSRELSTLGVSCFYGYQTYIYLQVTVGLG